MYQQFYQSLLAICLALKTLQREMHICILSRNGSWVVFPADL